MLLSLGKFRPIRNIQKLFFHSFFIFPSLRTTFHPHLRNKPGIKVFRSKAATRAFSFKILIITCYSQRRSSSRRDTSFEHIHPQLRLFCSFSLMYIGSDYFQKAMLKNSNAGQTYVSPLQLCLFFENECSLGEMTQLKTPIPHRAESPFSLKTQFQHKQR